MQSLFLFVWERPLSQRHFAGRTSFWDFLLFEFSPRKYSIFHNEIREQIKRNRCEKNRLTR